MAKQKKQLNSTVFEEVNKLFLEDTPEYHRIRELAEQDIGKELIERIEKFLENKDEPEVEEIKKVVFEDASKVSDSSINDLVDAFVRIRKEDNTDNLDRKSINDILILFNQWVAIGKGQQETHIPQDIFSQTIADKKQEKPFDLEEQVGSLRMPEHEELYKSHSASISLLQRDIYASSEHRVYELEGGAEFFSGPDHEHYRSSSAMYKNHGGKN